MKFEQQAEKATMARDKAAAEVERQEDVEMIAKAQMREQQAILGRAEHHNEREIKVRQEAEANVQAATEVMNVTSATVQIAFQRFCKKSEVPNAQDDPRLEAEQTRQRGIRDRTYDEPFGISEQNVIATVLNCWP